MTGLARRRAILAVVVVLGLALVLVLMAGWGRAASPRLVEGWAMPNHSGTAISLHDSPDGGPGEGYVVAGAWWQDVDGTVHDGADLPTCIGSDTTSRTHVRLGLVTVTSSEGGWWDHVTWVECLE